MKFREVVVAFGLVIALVPHAQAALADELGEVTRLQHAGQTEASLARADQYLAAHPRDAQMRFLKAVVLAEGGRAGEATALLEQLTRDYPELAEPHNNLAALHAAAGDFSKARAELEESLRLNPRYATAHENLGDVYAILAGEEYAKALRLEPGNATVPAKLAIVREITSRQPVPGRTPAHQ
ncbi:MAG: tetratricopeptide repeat protein [Caldimonas sp.]